jgi:hypothetical protein
MTITKTVLEWPYHPADYFEASYRQTTPGYDILVDAGIVEVTLRSSRPVEISAVLHSSQP